MKRAILFLAAGLMLLAAASCNDESKPVITRIYASPTCGVAPLAVQVYGVASGGDESGSATGGNNNLDFTWTFGDGHTSSTSIGYNTYVAAGTYEVRLRVEDPNGNAAERTVPVTVFADTFLVEASVLSEGPFAVGDSVAFTYTAASCEADPASTVDRARFFEQTWNMNDPASATGGVYTGGDPVHSFSAAGTYDVIVTVSNTGLACVRHDTLSVVVQ